MPKSARVSAAQTRNYRRRTRAWLGLGAVAVVALVTVVATALGASSALTLSSANSSSLGKPVVVNPQGHTLYTLSPETSKHLLCKSKECFTNWPPLTVKSANTKLKAGSGVSGKLAILRRSNGQFQVTLNGRPLYRFAGDKGKAEANGEGIESFGGTWHAVKASSAAATTPSMPSTPTTPTTSPEPAPYKY